MGGVIPHLRQQSSSTTPTHHTPQLLVTLLPSPTQPAQDRHVASAGAGGRGRPGV
jgi:hypothetical protein